MKGVKVYKNRDGFTIARLHYTADPDKDPQRNGQEWLRKALIGVPGGKSGSSWRKEMEIDPTAYSGQLLCYDLLVRHRHKLIKHKYVKDSDYIFAGLDWGRNNPASFHIYAIDEAFHIHSAYEIYLNDTSIPKFSQLIKDAPLYHRIKWIAADPSLWNKNQEEKEDLRSLEEKFHDEGITLTKGKSRNDEFAINELLDRWIDLDTREPTFTIDPRCKSQVWEFERLRYKKITSIAVEQSNLHETLVDKDNHSWDDFKYFISTYLTSPDLVRDVKISPNSPWARAQRMKEKRERR